jgi:hypothetical protein
LSLRGGSDRIGFFSKDGFVDIAGEHGLSAGTPQLNFLSFFKTFTFGTELECLTRKPNFRGGVECQIVALSFFVQIFFELIVIKFFFLVPVA